MSSASASPNNPAPPCGLLALPGPQFCYRYDGDFTVNGTPLIIHQEGGQGRGTGWSVWDGAATAAKHLEAAAPDILGSNPPLRSVVELGSGTGLAGLAAAAALRLPTVLTDLPEVLPSLQRNIAANPGLSALVSAAPLDWRQPHSSPALHRSGGGSVSAGGCGSSVSEGLQGSIEHSSSSSTTSGGRQPRLILAADCVWLAELVEPFVRTLQLAGSCPGDRLLLAYQSRSSKVDRLLFGLLAAAFDVAPAPVLPAEQPRGAIDVYWLTPRLQQQQQEDV